MSRAHQPSRRAYTLVELVAALAASSVLILGLASAIAIAARALPSADEHAARLAEANTAIDLLRADLTVATAVTETSAAEFTLTLPDRNDDGTPETATYTWDSAGDGTPFVRTLTNGPTGTIINNLGKYTYTFNAADGRRTSADLCFILPRSVHRAHPRLYRAAQPAGGRTVTRPPAASQLRPGVTMAEVALSTVIVAVVVVSAMNAAGLSRTLSAGVEDRAQAVVLAEELMQEILAQPAAFNTSASDVKKDDLTIDFTAIKATQGGSRESFTNADAYHRWTSAPPVGPDGTALTGFDNSWERGATVAPLDSSKQKCVAGSKADARLIQVWVARGDRTLAHLTAIRTRTGDDSWGHTSP